MSTDRDVPLSNEEHAELLVLYQVTTQDLAFFKSQQWTLTNYALIALAAIAGTSLLKITAAQPCARVFLCAAAILVGAIAFLLLWRLHCSIVERRERLKRVRKRLSVAFRDARGHKRSVSAWEMLIPLWGMIVGGTALVCWIVACGV